MEKRKKILWTIVFLLAAVLAGACFYCYPAWKAAKILQDKMDNSGFSYELQVELDWESQPVKQRKALETLAKLTGIREESLYRLTIKGSTQADRIHMNIYPEGQTEPLAEFFFNDDSGVINETMLYNAIRGNLAGQYKMLEYLMPRQKEELYMTLEQVEQLFGMDLSSIRDFRLAMEDSKMSVGQYFVILMAMKRETWEDGHRFAGGTEDMDLSIDVPSDSGDSAMVIRLRVENPAETLSEGERLLSWIGIEMPDVDLHALKSISVALSSDEEGTVAMPTDFVNQDIIDILSKVREWLSETFAGEDSGNIL